MKRVSVGLGIAVAACLLAASLAPARAAEGEGDRPSPEAGRRDGAAPKDGERPRSGPRDGEQPRNGPRDGEGPRNGPRDEGRPGAEQNAAGWLPGRVKAIDARKGVFLLEWRITEGGALRTVRGPVAVSPNTRYVHAHAAREGDAPAAASFRDLQVGAIVHVRGSQGPDGLYASEIRVFPLAANRQRPGAGREGDGRRPAEGEGRRSPERDRQP